MNERVKHPRTTHHPSSPGATSDDVTRLDLPDALQQANDVVITLKIDGENTTGYPDGYIHARSIDSASHSSRDWVKNRLTGVLPMLPAGWRVCGENLYAVHSIEYTVEHHLPDLFLVHSLWDENNMCVDWDTTMDWCEDVGLLTVPVIYRGSPKVDPSSVFTPYASLHEGWVMRTVAAFAYAEFAKHVVKWVRPNHVSTGQHWMHGPVRKNTATR